MFLASLTTLLTIFAVEYVATADVSGAYLHAEMDEVAIIKLEDEMVDVFCELDNQYKYNVYVSLEKSKRVLYLRLDKALYIIRLSPCRFVVVCSFLRNVTKTRIKYKSVQYVCGEQDNQQAPVYHRLVRR